MDTVAKRYLTSNHAKWTHVHACTNPATCLQHRRRVNKAVHSLVECADWRSAEVGLPLHWHVSVSNT